MPNAISNWPILAAWRCGFTFLNSSHGRYFETCRPRTGHGCKMRSAKCAVTTFCVDAHAGYELICSSGGKKEWRSR
jgi:hypothetical protein